MPFQGGSPKEGPLLRAESWQGVSGRSWRGCSVEKNGHLDWRKSRGEKGEEKRMRVRLDNIVK